MTTADPVAIAARILCLASLGELEVHLPTFPKYLPGQFVLVWCDCGLEFPRAELAVIVAQENSLVRVAWLYNYNNLEKFDITRPFAPLLKENLQRLVLVRNPDSSIHTDLVDVNFILRYAYVGYLDTQEQNTFDWHIIRNQEVVDTRRRAKALSTFTKKERDHIVLSL